MVEVWICAHLCKSFLVYVGSAVFDFVCMCLCVLHMLDSFFKQNQVHDSVKLIIMLQSFC